MIQLINKHDHTFPPTIVGFMLQNASLYPNLFVIFDGAAAFPVEAEAHQVNAEHAGEGLDACPLNSGSLCRQTQCKTHNDCMLG